MTISWSVTLHSGIVQYTQIINLIGSFDGKMQAIFAFATRGS